MDDPTRPTDPRRPIDRDGPPGDPEVSGGAAGTGDGDAERGVDHLQAAGREFVAAARSLLDAVETVVEDRARLGDLVQSVSGFVGDLVEGARGADRTPWGRVVPSDEPGPAPEPSSGPAPEPGADAAPEPPADPAAAHAPDAAPGSAPRTGRVRRIPVD